MKSFLIPAATTALLLTGTQFASAGSSCGMYQGSYHRAMMMHPGYGYGMPQAYRTGSYNQVAEGSYGNYMPKKAAKRDANIVDVAASAGSFNTLITAVKAAGLADTLAGEGPFTVFAPTDEAFAKLPAGTLEALLADKAKLTKVLT